MTASSTRERPAPTTDTLATILDFIAGYDRAELESRDLGDVLAALVARDDFRRLVTALVEAPIYRAVLGRRFASVGAVAGLGPCRQLRGSLNLTLARFFALLAQLFAAFDAAPNDDARRGAAGRDDIWSRFAERVRGSSEFRRVRVLRYATAYARDAATRDAYANLATRLERENPHALYPTSDYRESDGHVESTPDDRTIEAVMRVSTFSTIKIVDRALDFDQPVLRDIYASLGRCVCVVDRNVEALYGAQLERYFAHHGIALHLRVYRAMEIDKTIGTVERMLGEFKALGVSRNEPVLIVGGGVLADTAGLACALYGRNTPYVMLSTSIVTGIDAGPSPRTCCDGFGYKNLFGAYHPPVVSITDRFFFATLHPGWLRHGIAEIVKMSVVADARLFANLEAARPQLIETRFGTTGCAPDAPIARLSQKILGGALRSYVAVEYDNLYETHQCRPHAYGHTWSPGFEIEAGLLHGHAVSICMGLGAYLSHRNGWLTQATFHRILRLLDGYGLSLRHDILDDKATMWKSHETVIQKRGGNLVAPVPQGEIGRCGYLNDLTRAEFDTALDAYKAICATYPRGGYGIEALCTDVGLEDPATVALAAR